MIDTKSVREEAFQQLHKMPHFCADVILLIEELESARAMLSVKDRLLDDDAKIISGVVEHYKKMEAVTIAGRRFVSGLITNEEFEIVWLQFSESLKV